MLKIGDRIRIRREQLKMTQDELAQAMGYKSRSSINKIEKGLNEPPQSKIVGFAKVLKTTPGFLMGWEDDKPNAATLPQSKIHQIPVFSSVSAGFGAYACSDIVDYMPIFIQNEADVPDMLCIKVEGDSMYPKIEDGDIIVVRKQDSLDLSSIVLIDTDNTEFVRKTSQAVVIILFHSLSSLMLTSPLSYAIIKGEQRRVSLAFVRLLSNRLLWSAAITFSF